MIPIKEYLVFYMFCKQDKYIIWLPTVFVRITLNGKMKTRYVPKERYAVSMIYYYCKSHYTLDAGPELWFHQLVTHWVSNKSCPIFMAYLKYRNRTSLLVHTVVNNSCVATSGRSSHSRDCVQQSRILSIWYWSIFLFNPIPTGLKFT